MTKQLPVPQAPGLLEDYCTRFNDLLSTRASAALSAVTRV